MYIERVPGAARMPGSKPLLVPPTPSSVSPRVRALGVLGEDQVEELAGAAGTSIDDADTAKRVGRRGLARLTISHAHEYHVEERPV